MIESIPYVLTGIGIIISILYYTSVLRNANKTRELQLKAQEQATETRQTQIFMDLYKTIVSKQFYKDLESIVILWEYDDYEDYLQKYDSIVNLDEHAKMDYILAFYQGIALLVKRGLIDPEHVYKLMRVGVIAFWEKVSTIVEGERKRFDSPLMWIDIEDLYILMKEHRTKELTE